MIPFELKIFSYIYECGNWLTLFPVLFELEAKIGVL